MARQPFDALTLAELRQRQSLKWRAHPPDVLPLWVAEMDVCPAPAVRAALVQALDRGDTGYPWGQGYAEAYSEAAAQAWGWEPDPAAATLVADVMTGVVEVLGLVTGPGDAVILVPPVYPPFFGFSRHIGRRVLEAPLGPDDRLDLDALQRACAEATAGGRRAALLLSNPHNPTGTVHTAAELAAVAALAERSGVRVLADEIHAPLTYPGERFTPYLSVPGTERGFVLFSASKAWNLAGLKAALVIAGPDAAAELAAMSEVVSRGASSLAVVAHTAALRDGQDWLVEHLAGLDGQRQLLGRLLAERLPAVVHRRPASTYLAWVDCRPLALPVDPAAFFLERARVALVSGPDFGAAGAGYVRLNFATSTQVLSAAVDRMATAVERREAGRTVS